MKHNPGFLTAEELIESFIARQAELTTLIEIVRNNTRPSNQHVLVIGRRGMGKTTLVHRLALAIEHDETLKTRWYPLLFGEEAYGVSTAGELWLEALHQLAVQTGEARWRTLHVELRRERDDRRLRDLALARLLEFADERGVRLLITVENLQDILGDQMADDEGWMLRHTLLNEPRIMLLATATNRFDDIDKPQAATYEMFRVLQLRPLDRDECRVIWQRLTGETLEDSSIRPIEIFTGGNPRLLAILGGFAKGRMLREFMNDLLGLVDDHSDYFKSNLEALPIDERRAFVALCELWEPSLARTVAEVARFDVNKASMCLGRLVNRGAVEIVRIKGRAQYYQVSERLYNLFHRLRRSSSRDNRAASVVEFMTRFYVRERVPEIATRIAAEACEAEEDAREDYLLVLHHLLEKTDSRAVALAALPAEFWRIPEVRRKDLPWNPAWELQHFATLLLGIQSSWPGPLVDFDEQDAPVIQLWEQMLAGERSPRECFERAVSSYGSRASQAAREFCVVACLVKDEVLERETFASAQQSSLELAQSHLSMGLMASAAWRDPQFRAFAERHLLVVIEGNEEELAERAKGLLIQLYRASDATDSILFVHERALARRPSANTYREIGVLLAKRDPARAESAFRSALELEPHHPEATLSLVSLLARGGRGAEAVELLDDVFRDPSQVDFASAPAEDWFAAIAAVVLCLPDPEVFSIAQAFMQHARSLPTPEGLEWFLEVGVVLSVSLNPAVVQIAAECLARVPGPRRVWHVKLAFMTEGPERALDVLAQVVRTDQDRLPLLLDVYRDMLMQLALANPERLHAIAVTVPLLEPLAVALAQELGHDVLAPYEITEVAKDIRAELHQLRGPLYEIHPVPMLAAAEDSSRPRATKKPSVRRKPAAPKPAKPARKR